MLLKIKTKDEANLGTITFSESNQPVFLGSFDLKFKEFVEKLVVNHVERLIDVAVANNKHTIIKQTVSQSDPLFPLAFKEYLERQGYEVIEKHPETEEQIKQLLATFFTDNEDKKDILARLPEMSYLEQTVVLEGLKQIIKEN